MTDGGWVKDMKKQLRKIAAIAIPIVAVLVVLGFLQCLVTPKYVDDVPEGVLIEEYYDEDISHDVLFVGDCEVYENFSPMVLYDRFGINSYIRGSAQQLIWQSYFLLEDALRYEKPGYVVFNVLSLKYNEPQNEAYNRMTLDGMKWSTSKIDAINASMMEDESFMSYVFPILRYHDRITELTSSDFKYLFSKPAISCRGAYLRDGVVPATQVPTGKPLSDYSFGENAWAYLDRMRTLCEDEGIELILIKAPSLYPYWYDEWEQQVEDYAARYNLTYVNFLELQDETGIDYSTDTYDGGLHLNRQGAEKLSVFFGQMLSEMGVPDRRGDLETEASWKKLAERLESQASVEDTDNSSSTDTSSEGQETVSGSEPLGSTDTSSEGVETVSGSEPLGSADTSSEGQETVGDLAGFYFEYKGIKLEAGKRMSEYLDALGEPISYFEAKSCAFEGLDKMYSYPGFEVDTSPDENGEDVISMIFLADDSVSTVEGAYIGDSAERIEELYGASDSEEENVSTYDRGDTRLTVIFKNGYANSITYTVVEE